MIARNIIIAGLLISAPVYAQRLGAGGTMIDGKEVLEKCAVPIGTVSLSEEKKAAGLEAGLPPHLAAFMALARQQQGMSTVDPLPPLKMLAAQSNCFQVVDRGEAFNAIQRERQIAAGGQTAGQGPGATLVASDYVLVAQVVHQDTNAGGLGALGGGTFGGSGFKQSKKEAQVMLTLSKVSTGVQEAISSGQARKKDMGIALGGLLGMGIGALGGGYESTDIGKVTAAALLDGFNKMVVQLRGKTAATATLPARTDLPTVGTGTPAPVPALSATAAKEAGPSNQDN